jgi:eukaryotic-like serine/threonine-protein kinase
MTDVARLTTALADRYRILRELGAGGMATVYLAEDGKHHRQVALKVLRPELAAVIGAERFLKEIETTANLQHPHILPLFDSGTVDGTVFYVMPYVEGESLRERITRERQLPVTEAVRIAREVASALDYAHRKGIVHRDIKPENILLHDGQALVADFGIALAASNTGGTRMTETGMSLGTPHYMSPEQAMGERTLDARADVYALGCVLYEMLTGEPPFNGPTAQAIVARVMTDQARPIAQSRPTIPDHVEAAVMTALQKLPADRFTTAAEFSTALASTGYTTQGRPVAVAAGAPSGRLPWLVAGVALLVAAVALGMALERPAPAEAPVVRSVLRLPEQAFFSNNFIALSRDGSRLVAMATDRGTNRLLARRLSDEAFTPVAGSEDGDLPFLSPDGRWVAFRSAGQVKKALLDGGAATPFGPGVWPGDWTSDGTIYAPQEYNTGLFRFSDAGGVTEPLTTPDSTRQELGHWHPQLLPGGRHLIFTAFSTPIERARIEALDLRSGERTVLLEGAVFGRYVPTGHLLFARGTTVFAVPMSLSPLATSGTPIPVIEDVSHEPVEGRSAFAVSDNGTLVYLRASQYDTPSELTWHDRAGPATPVPGAPASAHQPAISPDGNRIAYTLDDNGWDVWVLDLIRGSRTRITTGGGADFSPFWTPDGERLVFVSERPVFDVYQRVADASAPAVPLLISPADKYASGSIDDGRAILYTQVTSALSAILKRGLAPDAMADTILAGGADYRTPALSPDGRWLAYAGNESGRFEVYIVPYPDVTSRRLQVSTEGGLEPRWTRNGREIVFLGLGGVSAAAFDPAAGQLGSTTPLFAHNRVPSVANEQVWSYDVTPDGQRFIMAVRPPGSEARELVVVTNWFKELREKMAGGRE